MNIIIRILNKFLNLFKQRDINLADEISPDLNVVQGDSPLGTYKIGLDKNTSQFTYFPTGRKTTKDRKLYSELYYEHTGKDKTVSKV